MFYEHSLTVLQKNALSIEVLNAYDINHDIDDEFDQWKTKYLKLGYLHAIARHTVSKGELVQLQKIAANNSKIAARYEQKKVADAMCYLSVLETHFEKNNA